MTVQFSFIYITLQILLECNHKLHIQTTPCSSCWFPFSIYHATWCSMTVSNVETRTQRDRGKKKEIREGEPLWGGTWCSETLFWELGVTSSLPLLSLCFKSAPMEQRRVLTMRFGPPPQSSSPMLPLLLHKKTQQWWKASIDYVSCHQSSWQIVAAGFHSQNSSVSPSILI